MLIYHKIAAQDSKRSHCTGSQVGDMEGSGLIEMLDEEIYNFKSSRNRDPDEVDRFINDLIKTKLISPRRGPVKPTTSMQIVPGENTENNIQLDQNMVRASTV